MANENQCDGCKRGLPIKNGIHVVYTPKGKIELYMVCTKNQYTKK